METLRLDGVRAVSLWFCLVIEKESVEFHSCVSYTEFLLFYFSLDICLGTYLKEFALPFYMAHLLFLQLL